MPEQTNNKTIAKNTLYLYARMLLTMFVGLFTSRVILQALGVDDYGIYQAVGGIVGFISFINNALSTGSMRFLTYEMGTGDKERLSHTFSSVLTAHIALALAIALVAETVGLWFLYNKMVIAPERMTAAVWCFHLSVISTAVAITQVPYSACINAHEKFDLYAMVSIAEVCLKLVIVYMLYIGDFDKLILYSVLFFLVNVGLMVFYRCYCIAHFEESKYHFRYDKGILRPILSFSGWSLFANGAIALNSQGVLILLNMFFTPAVVAARAISLQVNGYANNLVNNFRAAANPQIVKRLAAGDVSGSHSLLLNSTKYSFYLMWLLSLPICLLADPLLHLWLGVVPEYAVVFLQIVIMQSLFQVFDTGFYMALNAMGRLRENALISPTLGFIQFPVVYVLFKMGCSPVALSWASFIAYATLGVVIKPLLIVKIAHYSWKEITSVYKACAVVAMLSAPLPILSAYYINADSFIGFVTIGLISCSSIAVVVFYCGIDATTRVKVIEMCNHKLHALVRHQQ